MGLRVFQSKELLVLHNAEGLWIPQVDELAYTVLHCVIEFHANVKAVVPKVANADGMYGLLVLEHVVNIKPKTQASWGGYGQRAVLLAVAIAMSDSC